MKSDAELDALKDFIAVFPQPAHLKEPHKKAYIYSNQAHLKLCGFCELSELVGLNVRDLDQFMRPFWGNEFADRIDAMDEQVITASEAVYDRHKVFLDRQGFLHVQDINKTPVLGRQGEVCAIFTVSFEVTPQLSYFELYDLYKKNCLKKQIANAHFIRHLRIQHCFAEPLTEKEILCLLHMIQNRSYKHLAERMRISPRTAEAHISNISNKIKDKSLNEIIEILRLSHHYGRVCE